MKEVKKNEKPWVCPKKKEIIELRKKMQSDSRFSRFAPQLADVFLKNGLEDLDAISEFLSYDESCVPDISLMKDCKKFISRLKKAIKNREKIIAYTDYDCDGICSTAILVRALRGVGANIDFFINNRFTEGYGMNEKGMARLKQEHPDVNLIMTADNGIVAFDVIKATMEAGIDVIVSDHHEPHFSGKIPEAIAVCDAKRKDCKYPFKELCGAGVSYRLMCKLYEDLGMDAYELRNLLSFVALATVQDSVALLEENRQYVRIGSRIIAEEPFVCFKALRLVMQPKKVDEETIGFMYGPILNAIGRVNGTVDNAVRFLITDDEAEAMELGKELKILNEKRKELQKEEVEAAEESFALSYKDNESVIVIEGEFSEGIIGLIAGKFKEKYQKPVIVLSKMEECGADGSLMYKGSARSVAGFDMKEALDIMHESLVGYGGHAMAAGLTVTQNNINKLRNGLCDLMDNDPRFSNGDVSDNVIIDVPLVEKDLTFEFVHQLNTHCRPFGQGFVAPTIAVAGLEIKRVDIFGNNHVRLVADNMDVIIWRAGAAYSNLEQPLKKIDVIGFPEINTYREPRVTIVAYSNDIKKYF